MAQKSHTAEGSGDAAKPLPPFLRFMGRRVFALNMAHPVSVCALIGLVAAFVSLVACFLPWYVLDGKGVANVNGDGRLIVVFSIFAMACFFIYGYRMAVVAAVNGGLSLLCFAVDSRVFVSMTDGARALGVGGWLIIVCNALVVAAGVISSIVIRHAIDANPYKAVFVGTGGIGGMDENAATKEAIKEAKAASAARKKAQEDEAQAKG